MKLFTRTPVDLDHARLVAAFEREQRQAAEQEHQQRQAKREAAKVARRERRKDAWGKVRTVLPLLLINGGAAYSQAGYAYQQVAPPAWNVASKLAFAVAFATALESISIYVQWHAHDALMHQAHATAAKLRRSAWLIAAVIAGINYAHWAAAHFAPTAAAVAFGLLSLLSPWLWGLHTRRAQHMQLLAEDADAIDSAGVEFSPERRRAFPIRSYMARRWSIDNGVRHPQQAWDGYKAERQQRRAQYPAGKFRAAWACLRGKPPATVATTSRATEQPPSGQADGNGKAKGKAKKPATKPATSRPSLRDTVANTWAKNPEKSAGEIAELLGAKRRIVGYHMTRLRRAGQAPPERVNGSPLPVN